ncbi:protein Flattop-like [Pollicipes pollicipes]|uniref:protein Flattop-like n=1 Tax=Pollicipes pollicipes TaxID=41117 RepID=UPI001885027C|nr:protein Flattop-like [Pollicipes pollicipes]
MALTRGATQFEQQYDPKRIGNWELPDTPDSAPRMRHGSTKFIANDRGHLLENTCKSKESPWTGFRRTVTWDGPRRPAGPHSHSRPGYQNILKPPQGRQARESRPKGAVATHHVEASTDVTKGRPECCVSQHAYLCCPAGAPGACSQ